MLSNQMNEIKKRFANLADHCMELMLAECKSGVYIYEPENHQMTWLGGGCQFFGFQKWIDGIPGCLCREDYVHPTSYEELQHIFNRLQAGEPSVKAAVQLRAVNGEYHWVKFSCTEFQNQQKNNPYVIIVLDDEVAQIDTAKQHFYEEQLQMMLAEDVVASSKVNLTRNRVEYLWAKMVSDEVKRQIETYEQMYLLGLKNIVDVDGQTEYRNKFSKEALLDAYEQGQTKVQLECMYRPGYEQAVWVLMNSTLVRDAGTGDVYYYSYIKNIDEKKRTEAMLRDQAERDGLTGLYNKKTIEMMVEKSLHLNQDSSRLCVFMIVDIDNFKHINDTFGHPYGDHVIGQMGEALNTVFDSGVMKGRLGGDEFVVFAMGIPSKNWAFQKIRQLQTVLHQGYHISAEELHVTVSVGIAFSEAKDGRFNQLYRQADSALYRAKNNGKDQYAVFSSEAMAQ